MLHNAQNCRHPSSLILSSPKYGKLAFVMHITIKGNLYNNGEGEERVKLELLFLYAKSKFIFHGFFGEEIIKRLLKFIYVCCLKTPKVLCNDLQLRVLHQAASKFIKSL